MTVTNILRRGLATAAVSATGLAVLAGAALASAGPAAAQSAVAAPAVRPASLHTTGPTVLLGTLGSSFNYDFSEAPNGSVYYSSGRTVFVVHGTSKPVAVLHASGQVFAVAANRTELFVDVGRKVTGYKLSNGVAGVALRHWTLYTTNKTTSAGLYVVGSSVWAWTDWATDGSGFEYADVSRFKTSSGTVHKVSNNAYPADMAANSSGLYFQQAIGLGRLTHATPSGTVHRVRDINLDGPLALAGGRVELLAFHRNSHAYLDSYRASTLARVFSKRVSTNDIDIAGTGAGLLMLSLSGKISQLNASNGSTRSSVIVAQAATLVPGPSAAVVTVTGGNYFLIRLAG